MKIERDETKTEKLSLKLRALEDAATTDIRCYKTESLLTSEARDLYNLAKSIYEDAEKLEAVGMDHTAAVLIAMMNVKRKGL